MENALRIGSLEPEVIKHNHSYLPASYPARDLVYLNAVMKVSGIQRRNVSHVVLKATL